MTENDQKLILLLEELEESPGYGEGEKNGERERVERERPGHEKMKTRNPGA